MPEPTPQSVGRPPVVVVMGHIDHGKTTLLSAIRNAAVPAEAGGITQHIGAYQTEHNGKKITFLDTPGHEAFSAIRSRGARVADVAVLVVAADEGVKPQTLEALDLIQKAALPLVVAINKIDKPGASPEKVKGELAERGVLVEGWGGQIPAVNLSALGGEGVAELLEVIVLLAEVERKEGQPPTVGLAEGVVIESSLDQRRGALATVIPQRGVLKVGAVLAAGETFGKVRLLEDWEGRATTEAPPSLPVRVIGFKEPPKAGDVYREFPSLKQADEAAANERRERKTYEPDVVTLVSGRREYMVPLVIRADVQGSLEGIVQALKALPIGRVGIEILKRAVGSISDSDVKIAEPKGAVVMGFRVGVEPQARLLAGQRDVALHTFDVIYEFVEFVRTKMVEVLPALVERQDLGALTIMVLFKKTPQGQIVGGKVVKGGVRRGASAEVVRAGEIVGRGKILQLQHEKVDVEAVNEGRECGVLFSAGKELAVGDELRVFEETTKPQAL